MNRLQIKMWEALCNLDGEEVARIFTTFLGNQVLTRDLAEHMIDEGYAEAWELGLEEREEEED